MDQNIKLIFLSFASFEKLNLINKFLLLTEGLISMVVNYLQVRLVGNWDAGGSRFAARMLEG